VASNWFLFFSYHNDARSNKHQIRIFLSGRRKGLKSPWLHDKHLVTRYSAKNWITIPQSSVTSSDITSFHVSINNVSDKRTNISRWRINTTVGRVSMSSRSKELGRSAFSRC